MKTVFGIDIGGTAVKFGLFDTEGKLLDFWKIPTNLTENGSRILEEAADELQKKEAAFGIAKDDVLGVGLAVPGSVMADGMVDGCTNLGWGKFPLADTFSKLCGRRVVAFNDATAAAAGEVWQGSGIGADSLLMVTVGTGIGAGVWLGGKPWSGAIGSSGEIGHICIEPQMEEACSCGNHGCLEQIASERGMVAFVQKALAAGQKSLLQEGCDAIEIFACAKQGDALACRCVARAAEALGRGIAAANTVCDAERIVLGGGVMQAGEVFLEQIREYYRRYAFHSQKHTPLVLAKLGNKAGIYGAARAVLC